MSHLNPGLLSTYNSLTDKHLAGYFNNTRIRRHLQRVGLITRSGRIVPDKEYRHKLIRRDHQRHLRECLAQAIFHKVLDMERHHQIDIKRKLEDFARRERVHKIKVERSKRYDEDIIPLLSPRPPTGPRNGHKQHSGPEGEHSEFSESEVKCKTDSGLAAKGRRYLADTNVPGSSRPNTAPGKMQRPHRLQPIHSNCTTASARRTSPGYRHKDSSDDTEQQFSCTLDKDTRALTMTEFSTGISPYQLPVINNYITPVPPSTKRNLKGTPNGMMRGRRLRPTTAPGAPVKAKDSKFHKTSVHSNVSVIMVFYGKTVHLSHDDIDMRDEVKVFQQHCGGENLCVYKGRLMGGEAFQFVSRRHRGFPFSLTFFLNGLQVDRLSSCCEFKHRKGSRLGGKHGHFGFSSVEGASPCYKCIISMGLDKKPTPPPKRTKEDMGRGSFTTNSQEMAEETKEVEEEDIKQDSQSYTESGPIKVQAEDDLMTVEAKDVEEDKAKDDYEEDFEADNERADEDTEEAKLQDVNPTSSIVRGDSKINNKDGEIINHEMEDEEKGRNSNEFEQNDKAEEKKSPSCSSRSTSSSSSREDSESEAEEVKEAVKTEEAVAEDEIGQIPEEQLQIEGIETTSVPTAENDQRGLEDQMEAVDDGNLETSSQTPPQTTAVEGDTETRQSHGDSTEKLELLDTNMHPEEGKEVETIGAALDSGDNAAKPEGCSGDTEPERGSLWKGTPDSSQKGGAALSTPPSTSPSVTPVKSVQEKLIEAIMKEAHCSSEPELSDTSTEEEEELSSEIKTMVQNNNGVGEDKTDISSMQKPASTEGGNFESAVMPVEETSIEQPAEDQGICTEIEKEFEVGDTPVSVQEPPTEAGNSTDRKRKETGGEDSEPQTNRASSKTQLEAGEKTDAGENLTEMTEAMVGEPVNRKEQIYIESQKIMKVMKNTEASEAQAQESVDGALVKKGGNPEETNSETNETIAEETGTEVEETIGEVKTKSSDVATKEFTTGMADTKNQDAADYTENHVKGKKEETEAQTEEIEAQTEVTEAQVEAPEAQEEETEAQAEASKRQVEASEAQEEKTKTQTEESKTQTEEIEAQAEETEAQVEESEAQADETEAQVEVAEAEAENTEAQVEKTEAQSEEIKAQEEETKTQAEEIEAQAEETEAKVEAQAEETEAQADASEAHAEETNTRTEEIEVQAEASKTQEEENEAQVEASEAQAEETEAQVEEPEAQAEVIEAQAEASKTHEEDTEAQAEETEAQKESSEAQAEENEAQVEASEAQAEETEAQVEEPEAQAEVTEVQAEASEAQVEEPEAQAKVTEAQAEETEAQAEASGAQAEASETQAEETGSHVKASKTQKEETEAQAKASEAQAEENEAQVEASEAQAEETEAQVEEPEAQAKVTEAQAEASGAQAEASETQAEETGSHVKASKTQKEETEAQAEASEAQAEKTEAQAEETETQVEASITQEEENEAQPEASITQEEDTEAQAEETEAQKESSEAQAEETEAQVEASEAQAEETEAQIEEPEAQAEASEAQVEEPEAQAKVTEAQAEETEAQAEASEAQAEASETQAEETGSQVKASKTQEEETEAQAEAAGAQAEKTEAQAEETGTQVEASITQEEENEAQAEASITQEEDTEAQAEASEAQAEETEAQVEVTEAQVKASEAQVEEPKAQAEVTEAQTEASEAQAEETEAQAEAAGAQAEKTEAQAEETETQVEASITQEEENETQAVNFDAQAEDTSTEIDSTAVGSECTVAYVTKDDAERKDNRKETLKTQESGSEKLENGLKERTLSINVEIKAIENKDKEDEKKHGEAEKKEVHGDLTEIEKDDVESTRKKTDANEDNGVVNNEVEKFEMERKQEVTEGKNDVTDSKYETEAKSQDIQLKDRQKEAECGSKNGIKRKDTETTSQETEEIFEENEATEKYVEDDLRDKGTEAKSEEKDKEEEIEAPAGNKDSKAQEGENKDKVQLNTEQEARCDKTVVVKGDNGTIENVMTVDKEDEFIVSIEDKQDNEVVEVGETDAKGEEMEANRQTAVITAEGQSKVEDAIQEPMAELEEGERGPISFETGSKVDGYDDRVADVDSKAEEAVTGFEEVRAMAEEEKSKSNPPDLQSDIKAGVDSESKVRTEDIKDDEEETYVKTEVPFGSTKEEITETSDASEDKVVDIFAEGRDTILGNVVQEDEHGIDGIKQKPAAEEIKNHDVGEIARTSAGMKSEEQQSAEKIMDLENEGDLPFRKASNDEEEMNTEPEEYVVHPEGMGKVDEGDLVTNWINKHQALRCFQTFVEPLDDLNSFSLYERGQLSVEVSESTTAHTELPAFECSEKILDTTENNTATDTAALVQDVKSEEKVYTYTGNIEEDLLKKTESVTQLEIIENEGDQSKPVLEQQHIKEVCTRSNVSECGVPRGSEPRKEMSAEMQEEDTTVEEMMGLQSITKSYKCRDDDTENYVARTEDSDRVVRELGVANKESEGEEKDEVKTIEEMPGLTPIAKSEGKNSEGSESSASYCTTEDSGRNSGEAVPTKGMSLVNEENGTTGEEIAHFTFITETKDKNRKDAESLVPCSLEDVTYLTSVTGHGEKNGEDTGSPLHDSKSEEISRYLKESEAVNKESSMTEEQLCRTDELPARTTTPKTEEKKRDDKNVAPSHSKPEESDINSIESGDSKQKAEIDEGQNTVIKEIPNLTNSTEYKSKGVIEESGKLTVTREILGMQPFSVENPGLSTPTERRE